MIFGWFTENSLNGKNGFIWSLNQLKFEFLSGLTCVPSFSVKFRSQIENQASDYRLLGASDFTFLITHWTFICFFSNCFGHLVQSAMWTIAITWHLSSVRTKVGMHYYKHFGLPFFSIFLLFCYFHYKHLVPYSFERCYFVRVKTCETLETIIRNQWVLPGY